MIINFAPAHKAPTNGDLKLCGGCVYKVLDSHYITGKDAHLEVEVEDVTDTEAGQALIIAEKTNYTLYKARAKYVFNRLRDIQDYGVLVELVDGKMLTLPDGEDLSAMFDISNLGTESGRFIWLQPEAKVRQNYL